MVLSRPFRDRSSFGSSLFPAIRSFPSHFGCGIAFTKGLGVTVSRKEFEAALKFMTKHYTPVRLQDVLSNCQCRGVPPRAVLVTFDDAYASVSEFAAPLCAKFGVPAVFFVNVGCLDNRNLALENLVCYVANVRNRYGQCCRSISDGRKRPGSTRWPKSSPFLPRISLLAGRAFRRALVELAGIDEGELAQEAGLYLTSQQIDDLADLTSNSETIPILMQTAGLSREDFGGEIDRNKNALEAISGIRVRSFSVPYGSSADLTPILLSIFSILDMRQSSWARAKPTQTRVIFPSVGSASRPIVKLLFFPKLKFCLGSVGSGTGFSAAVSKASR